MERLHIAMLHRAGQKSRVAEVLLYYAWVRVQVPPKARAALQVNEARLALLLQAVRTSLQLPASAHSFRLAAVDITNQLAHCQVPAVLPLLLSLCVASFSSQHAFVLMASRSKYTACMPGVYSLASPAQSGYQKPSSKRVECAGCGPPAGGAGHGVPPQRAHVAEG